MNTAGQPASVKLSINYTWLC